MGRMMKAFLLLLFCGFAWADEIAPLLPVTAGTTTISCTSSSAATALSAINSGAARVQLEVQNAGTSTIFVEPGLSTVTAAVASGYPILAGQSKVISVSPRTTHIACITASATVSLHVTVGAGN